MALNQNFLCSSFQLLFTIPPPELPIDPNIYAQLKVFATSAFVMMGVRPDPKVLGALVPVIPTGIMLSAMIYQLKLKYPTPPDLSAMVEAYINTNLVPDLPPIGFLPTMLKNKIDLRVPTLPIPSIDVESIKATLRTQMENTISGMISKIQNTIDNELKSLRTSLQLQYENKLISYSALQAKLKDINAKILKMEQQIVELQMKVKEAINFEIPIPQMLFPIKTSIQAAMERCNSFYQYYQTSGVL